MENVYLGKVLEEQQRVEQELRQRVAPARLGRAASAGPLGSRVTGFWRFRTVVVPPNVYVVHTRRGRPRPLHLGLGLSFRFDPARDAFLLVPAAVQTILISASCICRERQGIMVQAYVQWVVSDLETAYRTLDLGDPDDPMRIVNVQLREQAEAAVKDKVATMSIDDVLADKQPIIEELTTRLSAVAEGGRGAGSGLGLKIVTVQIKEAVVSSARLWEHLQAPFRAERERLARMAHLDAERLVDERTLHAKKEHETSVLETEGEVARLAAEKERERWDREEEERARRRRAELEAFPHRAEHAAAAALLERGAAEREEALAFLRHEAAAARSERDLALAERRRTIDNDLSPNHLRALLVQALPEVAARLQAPKEVRTVTVGTAADAGGPLGQLLALVAGAAGIVERGSPSSSG